MANARDVEANLTVHDRSAAGLGSAERNFARTSDNLKRRSDEVNSKLAKNIVNLVETVSPRLAASLTSAFGTAGSAGAPLLVAGLAAATPLLAASLSAAVIGGVGVGGVIGGIALVADDPRVKAAGGQLGRNLLSGLKQDATPFVQPVLAAADRIDAKFTALRPKIAGIFANSARFVAPLTTGVLRGVDGIVSGIERLTSRAQPVMDQLGDTVGDLGEAFGRALDTLSRGGDGAAAALKNVTNVLTLMVDIASVTILALTKVYGWLDKIGAASGFLGILAEATGNAGDESENAASGFNLLGQAMSRSSADVESLTKGLQEAEDAVAGVHRANRALYASTTDVAQAVADATKEIRANGRTLDQNTQKGRENRTALIRVANALQDNYEKYVAVNGAGRAAEKVADSNRSAFIRLARQAGATAGQAQRLANELFGIPKSRTTNIQLQKAEAERRLAELKRKYDQLRSKQITVDVYVNASRLNKVYNQLDRYGGAFTVDQAFQIAAPGEFRSRTGGPTPVSLTSTLESRLYLDGSLIYERTDRQIQASERRQQWRTRVGKR
jgi:hypothetical protein